MRRRLLAWILLGVVALTGCGKEKEKEEEKIKLVWQSHEDLNRNAEYFNKILQEKGYPYEVEFVTSETVKNDQVVDIMETGMESWEKPYDTDEDVREGKLLALDEYLKTEKGRKIKETVPQKMWDSYKIDGKQYSILMPGQMPYSVAYIWNTELAKKYDVHPETWTEDIWDYEEEFRKIAEQERKSGNENFLAVSDLLMYSEEIPGLTHALGIMYPIVIQEEEENPRAEFLYETEYYQESLAKIRKFYELGLCDQEKENRGIEPFFRIETVFQTKNGYLAFQEDDFWDTHEVKTVYQETMWELGNPHRELGITTESKKPEAAFDLLYLMYTDGELVNALSWGEEGVSYEVVDGKAVEPGTKKGYIPRRPSGNMLLAYPEVNSDKNFGKLYPAEMEKAAMSKLSGFRFHGENVKQELDAVAKLGELVYAREEKIVLDDMEEIIQKYKEAGINKIVEEWNRQFSEWKRESR